MSEMGTFRIDVEVENPARPGERRRVANVLVDTGAELSWLPSEVLEVLGIERYSQWRFRQASGAVVERWVGPAFLHVGGKRAVDEVVFGQPGELVLLGARSLEGLNLRVELTTRQLVDAGPAPAALAGEAVEHPAAREACHLRLSEPRELVRPDPIEAVVGIDLRRERLGTHRGVSDRVVFSRQSAVVRCREAREARR